MSFLENGFLVPPSCPSSDFKACGHGLPSNFCCEQSRTCIPLAANTTALCCPEGGSCELIRPITCNIQVQNATVSPEGPVFTTALNSTLPRCGHDETGASSCCPFGYVCESTSDQSICVLDEDQASYSTLVPSPAPTHTTTISIAMSAFTHAPTHPTATLTAPPSESTAVPASSGGGLSKGIIAGTAAAASISVIGLIAFAWIKRARFKRALHAKTAPVQIVHQTHLYPRGPTPMSHRKSAAPTLPGDIEAPRWEPKSGELRKVPSIDRWSFLKRDAPANPPLADSFSPVELPATPLTYATLQTRVGARASRISRPPPALIPTSRFSTRSGDTAEQPNFF